MRPSAASSARRAALPRRLRSQTRCRSRSGSPLDQTALALIALDALEQRAEVAGAEALAALALDDLVEERTRRLVVVEAGRFLEEDLQHVLVVMIAVDQHLELAQRLDILVDLVDAALHDPLGQHVVVRARRRHEADAV